MRYRILHDGQKVLSAIQDNNSSLTYPGDGLYNVQTTIAQAIEQLTATGIDISFFWKQGLINQIEPDGAEVAISPHPSDENVKRKVFVYGMPVEQNERYFRLNLIIRHFNSEGVHIPDQYDDMFYSSLADNSKLVESEGIGEYDYFKSLVDAGANLFNLQVAQIPVMDILGRFNHNLYI